MFTHSFYSRLFRLFALIYSIFLCCPGDFGLAPAGAHFAYRTFLRWPLPRRCLMRSRSGDPDVWRVSIRFLGDPEEPPNVISHGTVEASPSSTLHDLVQGIEHEGCLTSAAHGVEVIAYTSAPAPPCLTARPLDREHTRMDGSSPSSSSRRSTVHNRVMSDRLVCHHAASVTGNMLADSEHQFLAVFTTHVHQRLMHSRGTGPPAREYAETACLTTRACVADPLAGSSTTDCSDSAGL